MAGLFRQELGQFSLKVNVILSTLPARGAPDVIVYVTGLSKENSSGSRKGWWVSLPFGVTDHFVNPVTFMEAFSKKCT